MSVVFPESKLSVYFSVNAEIKRKQDYRLEILHPRLSLGILFGNFLFQRSDIIEQFLSLSTAGIFVEYVSIKELPKLSIKYNAIAVDPSFLIGGIPKQLKDYVQNNGNLLLLPPLQTSTIELWFTQMKQQLELGSGLNLLKFSSFDSREDSIFLDGDEFRTYSEIVGISKNGTSQEIENRTFFNWISNGYVLSVPNDNFSNSINVGLVPPFQALSHVLSLKKNGSTFIVFSSSFMFVPSITSGSVVSPNRLLGLILSFFSPVVPFQEMRVSQTLRGLKIEVSLEGIVLQPSDVRIAFSTNISTEQIQISVKEGNLIISIMTDNFGLIEWELGIYLKNYGLVTYQFSFRKTIGISFIGEILSFSPLSLMILGIGVLTVFLIAYTMKVLLLFINVRSNVVECPRCNLRYFEINSMICSWCNYGGEKNE